MLIRKGKFLLGDFSFNRNSTIYALGELFNQIVPILVYPLLLARIGLSSLGGVVLYQIIIGYGFLFVQFGLRTFGASSLIRANNTLNLKFRLSSLIFLNFIVFFLVFLIIIMIVFLFNEKYVSILVLSLSILGSYLISNIFYLGLNKLHYLTFTLLGSQFLYLILIYFFVNHNTTSLEVIFIRSISNVVFGILGLVIIKVFKLFSFKCIKLRLIKYYFSKGFVFLSSEIIMSLKDKAHYFLIADFINFQAVAVLDGGQKLLVLIQKPSAIFSSILLRKSSLNDGNLNSKDSYFILLIASISFVFYFLLKDFVFEFGLNDLIDYLNFITIYLIAVVPLSLSSFIIQNYISSKGLSGILIRNNLIISSFYLIVSFLFIIIGIYSLSSVIAIILFTYFMEMIYLVYVIKFSYERYTKTNFN